MNVDEAEAATEVTLRLTYLPLAEIMKLINSLLQSRRVSIEEAKRNLQGQPKLCTVCGQFTQWRACVAVEPEHDLCFLCTTGETDGSDDYEVALGW